jgi:hypothetical protein
MARFNIHNTPMVDEEWFEIKIHPKWDIEIKFNFSLNRSIGKFTGFIVTRYEVRFGEFYIKDSPFPNKPISEIQDEINLINKKWGELCQ